MKKFLSLVLALVMTMSLVTVSAGAKDFTDDSKIAYDEAVAVMSEVKVVDGYANGSFNPQATLTRGAAAKIICNLILGPTTASALTANQAPYKDVAANHTFAGYIAFCKEQGIISGYADGTFRPAATLTSYAFMKMLLGALGYDAEVEHYVGANWSIQVAKRALNIGLADDLKTNFVGTKPVTREEACLYAFNALQADMVEYDTTIQIGNITVAGSKAEVCAQGAYKDTMNEKGLQFAEKYFTNLKKVSDNDSFKRPATTWKLKNDTIGTYADTADLTYTTAVKGGDIYKDLDSKVYNKNLTVYVDGEQVKNTEFAIVKGNDKEIGGNGTLTEVYYDHDTESAVIVQVNTYVGQVAGTHKATSKADAYITIEDLSTAAPGTKMIYTTDDKFENETKVLYTYSKADNEIKSVVEAQSVTGKVTEVRFDKDDTDVVAGMTINGEKYETSKSVFKSANMEKDAVKAEYTIYLDGNGYVVLAEKVDELSSDYALVLSTKRDQTNNKPGTDSLVDDLRVKLAFADGTVKVVNTDKKSLDNLKKAQADKSNDTGIVSYREESDGTYTLRAVKFNGKYSDDAKFELESGRAGIHVSSADSKFYGNSNSIFVIYNNKNDSWDAYTGIKSVPSVKSANGKNVTSYTYAKADYVKIMFIVPADDSLVESKASSELFIVPDSASKLITDGDSAYYVYNAIVNGEIKTIKVDELEGKVGGFYKNYSLDKYDVYSNLSKASDTTDYKYRDVIGLDKTKADYTVTLGTDVYTVADKASFFYVDENHDVFESSYKSVVADKNDKVFYVLKDNQVVFMVTVFVEDKNGNTEQPDIEPTLTVTVKDGAITVDNPKKVGTDKVAEAIVAELNANGYKDVKVQVNGGDIKGATALKNSIEYNFTVTVK